MKIDTLKSRENFKKITKETLKQFFKSLYGKSYSFNWKPISFFQSKSE